MKKRYSKLMIFILAILLVACDTSKIQLESIKDNERLFVKDNMLYLEKDDNTSEIASYDNIESIYWSDNGKLFLVNEENKSYLYNREELKEITSFNSNGNSIFLNDNESILYGDNEFLKIYYLDGRIEEIYSGNSEEKLIPKSFIDNTISFEKIIGDNIVEDKIELIESEEDNLIKLVDNNEDISVVIELLYNIDFNVFREVYGSEGIEKVLNYINTESIYNMEDIKKFFSIADRFNEEEYYRYIDVIGKIYLDDIVKFTKAIYDNKNSEKILHGVHDLKLYDRELGDITEDLNNVINSDELTDNEKKLGISMISSYADCGA